MTNNLPKPSNTILDILDHLNDKYSDRGTQELLDIASALDPRLKYVDEDIGVSIVDQLKVMMEDEGIW